MKKWKLAMSNTYEYTEMYIFIVSEREPTHQECNAIAKENGYKIWGLTEL